MKLEEFVEAVRRLDMGALPPFIQTLLRASQHLVSKYFDGADIAIYYYEDGIIVRTRKSKVVLEKKGEEAVIVFRKYDEEGRLVFVKRASAPAAVYELAEKVLLEAIELEREPSGYELWPIYKAIGEEDSEPPDF
ncbi:MAG: hypothetical protein DRJ67_04040 [Thermoprotei archaeon]|nr:MAG: hypothetical protein DRJ67_04040 [Thermoprotei archaeon]